MYLYNRCICTIFHYEWNFTPRCTTTAKIIDDLILCYSPQITNQMLCNAENVHKSNPKINSQCSVTHLLACEGWVKHDYIIAYCCTIFVLEFYSYHNINMCKRSTIHVNVCIHKCMHEEGPSGPEPYLYVVIWGSFGYRRDDVLKRYWNVLKCLRQLPEGT